MKFKVTLYNYRLDTSNPEEVERNYELKQQAIKLSWINITVYFLDKGKKARFKYWAKDVAHSNAGYRIKKLIELDTNHVQEKAEDNLSLLTVILNDGIKDFIIQSMHENHIPNSPFFHFDILNENDISIYTSQDFGDNI